MSEIAVKEQHSPALSNWFKKEDSWAIIIALGIILLATAGFLGGGIGLFKTMAVAIPGWSGSEKLTAELTKQATGLIYFYVFAVLVFSGGAQVMGYNGKRFAIPAAARRGAMLKLLASRGFVINRRKNRIVAESGSMEAQAVKRCLLEHGFQADEFQVYLEYTRQWGML